MNMSCAEFLKNEFLSLVATIADEMGVKAYLVGGGLRDLLTGRQIKDLDFALEDRTEELAMTFARRLEGTFFWLNEQRMQARVVKKGDNSVMTFDFAPLRGHDIVQDLRLRDFTINAFAVSLTDGESSIIDPLNGVHDLRESLIIRACAEDSFDHDPLRLLRAIRFTAIPGFSIEPGTWRKIREKATLLQRVAPERIRAELFQMLDGPHSADALGTLHDSGLLPEIIPVCFTSEQGKAPTIQQRIGKLVEVEEIMSELHFHFFGVAEDMHDYLYREVESGVTMASLVKLAAFLGNYKSNGESVSATTDRLKLGCKARQVLEILCVKVRQMTVSSAWKLTQRAIFRFFRDNEPAGPGALIIALAGKHLSAELCADMAKFYFTDYPNICNETLLSGEEIMNILHTGPGWMVGKAMKLLKDAESAGLVNNKAEALAYLGKNLLTKEEAVI